MRSGARDIWEKVHGYIAFWQWPGRLSFNTALLQTMFCPKRKASSMTAKFIKGQASDFLSLNAVLAYFLRAVLIPGGRCLAECRACEALCDIVECMQAVALNIITPVDLRARIDAFYDLCEAAGWRKFMHPKFHWLVHLPQYLQRLGMLLSCFVHERRHRMLKRYADDVKNTRGYERTLLSEITCHHLASLKA